MAANGAANAQSTGSSGTGTTDLASQFGGFELNSRGNGLVVSYDSPGLLPVGSPLFEVGLPESQTTQSTGPSGYALASLAYPGSAVADLGTLLAVGGAQTPIPPYPIRSQSFYPGGPTTADQVIATASGHTSTTETSSDAVTQYNGADLPTFMKTGTITVTSHTGLEDGQVVSRIRVEENDVNLLFGVIQIGSIVTDLVANSNGTEAASDGTTTVSGVKFAGRDAVIDGDGIHLVTPTTSPSSTEPPTTTPLDPLTGPLGSIVDPAAGGAAPGTDALNTLITSTVGSQGTLNDLLKASGIKVQLLAPVETKDGGQVTRLANGLLVEIDYDGRTQPVLSQLIGAVPSGSLPADSLIPGVPLNSSPQALYNLLKEKDVVAMAIASGSVKAVASPAFELGDISVPGSGILGSGSTTGSRGAGGFSTATPGLGTSGASGGGGGSSVGDILPIDANGGPLAAVVSLFALALLGSLSWFGSGRLADNVLSEATSSCPEGLDRTPPPTGGST
jgi:hypothetical protein